MIPLIFLGPIADAEDKVTVGGVTTASGSQPALAYLCFTALAFVVIIVGSMSGDIKNVDVGSGYYWGLVIGGLLAGCGIATFPMTINVMFWFDKKRIGSAQATYAGVGNVMPGIFAFIIPLIMSSSEDDGLLYAYIVWIIFLVICTVISLFMVYDPPY